MSVVAIAIGGSALLGAGVSLYEDGKSQKVANTQLGLEEQTAGEQSYYNNMLMQLLQNPASVSTLPGFQFEQQQGTEAVQRGAAAGGFLNSGKEGAALETFGTGLASQFYGQQTSLLAGLSGVEAASSPSSYGSAAVGGQNSANDQLNNLLANLGIGAGRFGLGSSGSPSTAGGWNDADMNSAFAGSGAGGLAPIPAG